MGFFLLKYKKLLRVITDAIDILSITVISLHVNNLYFPTATGRGIILTWVIVKDRPALLQSPMCRSTGAVFLCFIYTSGPIGTRSDQLNDKKGIARFAN